MTFFSHGEKVFDEKAKITEAEEITFPVNGSRALRIVLEDSETSFFIKTYFSYPEQKPTIISRKWISRCGSGCKWNVEIMEKKRLPFAGKNEIINLVLVEVDPFSGQIIKRQYFRNIFMSEYKDIFAQRYGKSGIQ